MTRHNKYTIAIIHIIIFKTQLTIKIVVFFISFFVLVSFLEIPFFFSILDRCFFRCFKINAKNKIYISKCCNIYSYSSILSQSEWIFLLALKTTFLSFNDLKKKYIIFDVSIMLYICNITMNTLQICWLE